MGFHLNGRSVISLAALALSTLLTGCGGGDSTSPLSVTTSSSLYDTVGSPADTLITDNGYVLVSVSGASQSGNPTVPRTGLQVFAPNGSGLQTNCAKVIELPNPGGAAIHQVMGIKFYPGSQDSIGAAVENEGVEFFRTKDLAACSPATGGVNVPQPPNTHLSKPPSSFDLVFAPDGRFAFVGNEYAGVPGGQVPPPIIGAIGVIGVVRDPDGDFSSQTKPVSGEPYVYVPGGNSIPGVTISHNGKYLYVTSEVAEANFRNPTQTSDEVLVANQQRCYQKAGGTPQYNGLLTVIDVDKATSGMGQKSIISTIASGCSPVRVSETADGKTIWVSARGDNRVLAFDTAQLISGDPNKALIGYADTGGTAPVGIALLQNDRLLAIANSNRFTDGVSGVTNVTLLDVTDAGSPRLLQSIPSPSINAFPRFVKAGPDDSTLYVTNANAAKLQVIETSIR